MSHTTTTAMTVAPHAWGPSTVSCDRCYDIYVALDSLFSTIFLCLPLSFPLLLSALQETVQPWAIQSLELVFLCLHCLLLFHTSFCFDFKISRNLSASHGESRRIFICNSQCSFVAGLILIADSPSSSFFLLPLLECYGPLSVFEFLQSFSVWLLQLNQRVDRPNHCHGPC